MGFFDWFRNLVAPSPARLMSGSIVGDKPLHEQFQRIGGGIGPTEVTAILRAADSGQPAALVDLTNESRSKDGHMAGVLGTRDRAVSLLDLEIVEPEDASAEERAAGDLCRRIRDDFRNWPVLVSHLTGGGYLHGHATAELLPWEMTDDGLLLPLEAKPLHARDFIFAQADGSLRYRTGAFDTVGIDLLADYPGRIVQVQRRIVGDVPAREGLARLLVWSALLRNWTLRDWVALGELGWKPWRIGTYKKGTQDEDIDRFIRMLERIGSTGVGLHPDTIDLKVEWPKGSPSGSKSSTHHELFATLGREQSKAVLGQTTTTEPGENGDRASTETRDEVRKDIREEDARAVAAALRYHIFMPAIAVNIGGNVRVPSCFFNTDEGEDQLTFSQSVKNLREAGVRIPAAWVRERAGMPEPIEGEEVLEGKGVVQVPDDLDDDSDEDGDGDKEKGGKKAAPARTKQGEGDTGNDGPEYAERLMRSGVRAAAQENATLVGELLALIAEHDNVHSLKQAAIERFREELPPAQLADVMAKLSVLARLGGRHAVHDEG